MSSLYTRLKITLGKANADEHALAAMQSDYKSSVADDHDILFNCGSHQPDTGVILYQGGRCDPRAYAPVMRTLANIGYRVIIPKMPLRLAVLDANRASKIMAQNPDIKKWVIGGHSMGGAMAAAYVYKNPGMVNGLFFMASYPSSMHAMPGSSLPMTMIYGTHDFITRKSEFEASYDRLPKATNFIAIEGGDHYQFGSFGNVEVTATISRADQQRQATQALVQFLGRI
jgi:predicted esterase